ncbi:DUF4132 domain-containing protein [Dactylosporangium fulvum]|uniref:DUF4132 domain-containing protein n=1 Tax=Dactylosporangium fulvum TaxID=53359 RepID=A0ABY5WAE5_9ACTN|nr:DUF4132 domain-containing protein [Dactylosporangium fulvum]UWP85046.1 DUF4132 domain-containing protein [Dactylosporangium fulvum]
MTWLAASGGYEVTLVSGQIACRNAKGKVLRSMPAALRDDAAVVNLRQLVEWLGRHEAQVREQVDLWMVRSLPVPAAVLARVWPDEVWRAALTDLVVAVLDDDGGWDPDEVGFLRDAGPEGVGIVNLDGETVRLPAARVAIPHPVRLPDLDDLREFAADLGVEQSVDQLFRQTWTCPADLEPAATSVGDYAGGRFAELRHLLARAASQGYPVKGGYAVCRVFEDGSAVEARSWVGADDPYSEAETGDLVFVRASGSSIPLGEIGPVAWSEGMRMAAALYAGRIVEQSGEEAAA